MQIDGMMVQQFIDIGNERIKHQFEVFLDGKAKTKTKQTKIIP